MTETNTWQCEFCGCAVTHETGRTVCVVIPDPKRPGRTANGWRVGCHGCADRVDRGEAVEPAAPSNFQFDQTDEEEMAFTLAMVARGRIDAEGNPVRASA